jgi:outer membrane protein assembly factor BamB
MPKQSRITRRQSAQASPNLSAAAAARAQRAGALLELSDWQTAAQEGWTFADSRDARHAGQVSVLDKVVRMADDQDGDTGFAEIAYPRVLSVPERFALAVRMRFLDIGQEDDSTGQYAHLSLILGVKSPSGDFGLDFRFIADRYKVDGQYKIFRTQRQWHDWRFEVDTRKKTVAMFRDGEYVCLHRGGAAQESGLRLRVQGSAAVPASVEIAELQLLPLPAETAAAGQSLDAQAPEGSPEEWPMWRRDRRNTAFCPMTGQILQPQVAWQIPVGGVAVAPYFLDLDGDGVREAVVSYGGNLAAYRPDGATLWRQRLENATVYGVFDLDDDGEPELLITAGVPAQVRILRGRDGQTLATCAPFPKDAVAGIRVAKLDPAKKGLQAVVWSPQHELGFCLAFDQGARNAQVSCTFDWQVTNFTPEVALADMDRDGLLEIVIATYDHVFVIDGRTGAVKMRLEIPVGRNYGTLVVKDVDGDGYPDVVLLEDQLREHVAVVKNEAGRALRLLWNRFYEQNYPEDHKALRVLNESADDFDGDGNTEIAYSLFDDTADAKWHTLIVDAVSGAIKADIPGRYLVGAGALFPERPPVLFLSTPSSRTVVNLEEVAVWSGSGGAWQERLRLPTGRLLTPGAPLDFALPTWSLNNAAPTTVVRPLSASPPQQGLCLVRTDGQGRAQGVEFLTGDRAGRIETTWQSTLPSDLPSGTVVRVDEVIPDLDGPQVFFSGEDSVVRAFDAAGRLRGSIATKAGFITAPVAAKLRAGEPLSVLFMDSRGDICCIQPPQGNEPARKRWSHPSLSSPGVPVLAHLRPLGCPCVPMVADLNGQREILIAQEPDRLVALNAEGKESRSWKLPALPMAWTYGNFDGDDALDLFVTYPVGQWVDVESRAIAGRDGQPLWRSHCGNGPAAIYDLDGDGLDDLTLRDLFEHRTLSGRTGRDIAPITQWAGYHTPIIVPLERQSRTPGIVWVGGAYSLVVENLNGEQTWWKPFMATGMEAVADVDGDGRMEVGGVTTGQLYNWPDFYAVDGPNKEFVCCDALTGEVKWSYPLDVAASAVVSADVDGDGNPEFVFGTRDGRLIALRGGAEAPERRLWELTLPASLGMPVICDVDGDGEMEILVSCADGNLYCVQRSGDS